MVPWASQRMPSSFAAASSKISMNEAPDAPALLLRVARRRPARRGNRSSASILLDVDAEMARERRHDLVALVEPEQAVVDEDAGQALADRTVQQRRDHRGVDTAREREQDARRRPTSRAHALDAVADDRGRGPARGAAADVVHEPAQDARALAGMGDLGMELDPVEAAGIVGDSGNRCAVGRCDEA